MSVVCCRSPLRQPCAAALLLWLVLPLPAAAGLTLNQAERAALQAQPQLQALEAAARAARERAVRAGELPDPRLTASLTNLPVTGAERFDLGAEPMTMSGLTVSQEFPRAQKRRLRSRTQRLAAEEAEARRATLRHAIHRDAALAYLGVWAPDRAAQLVAALIDEAQRARDAAEIGFRSGREPQVALLAAELALELLRDRRLRLEQDAAEGRERLRRWTGEPVPALAAAPPALPQPPPLPVLLDAVAAHPELSAAEWDIAQRETALALAESETLPDWRVELGYGYRQDYGDLATLQLGIDLPLFPRQRQHRDVAAAAAELAATESTYHDRLRRLQAEAAAAWRAWSGVSLRLQRYDDAILPAAQARAEATLVAYRAATATLAEVLDARQAALDVRLMRLDLQTEVLRRLAELRYFNAEESR